MSELQDESQAAWHGCADPGTGARRRRTTVSSASPPTSTTTRSVVAREREEYVALADARLLTELIPVVDDLEGARALASSTFPRSTR